VENRQKTEERSGAWGIALRDFDRAIAEIAVIARNNRHRRDRKGKTRASVVDLPDGPKTKTAAQVRAAVSRRRSALRAPMEKIVYCTFTFSVSR
jgi:hypothetical protein